MIQSKRPHAAGFIAFCATPSAATSTADVIRGVEIQRVAGARNAVRHYGKWAVGQPRVTSQLPL
jgi:hypothetical protein